MRASGLKWALAFGLIGSVAIWLRPPPGETACCYFSAKDKDILQPAQKAFLTFNPETKVETFTVQPKFEGNAVDFGMVIPTPARPKLDPMPRDFFKHLALMTILKHRKHPESKLLPVPVRFGGGGPNAPSAAVMDAAAPIRKAKPAVVVLEAGVVGTLEYKIIEAGRADDLYQWLKENKYSYSGDESTLDFYIKKSWIFTVMKIDTAQMKKNADGSFAGEVTPTRFQFKSEQPVYPLKITQISVKDKTEALFYVQAPYKTDLEGDMTYQYQWIPMLMNARGWYAKGIFGTYDLPGKADDWLKALGPNADKMVQKGQQLGYGFNFGQRPTPNRQGKTATTLEWARQLSLDDIKLCKGEVAFTEKVPDPDEGFKEDDLKDSKRAQEIYKTIQQRLDKYRQDRPGGWLVREAPDEEVKKLKELLGHVQEGQFVTKFRRTFIKGEMNDDLKIVAAKWGDTADTSEYTEKSADVTAVIHFRLPNADYRFEFVIRHSKIGIGKPESCYRMEEAMRASNRLKWMLAIGLMGGTAIWLRPPPGETACCYFSAKDKDILQPAQKAFLTFDPDKKVETFTVQPKFEGNAVDFGMVIPTPAQPKLDPMPRDFFKHLAVMTILKHRKYPESKLVPPPPLPNAAGRGGGVTDYFAAAKKSEPRSVRVLEAGVVGTLEYKIIEAGRADDLYQWLKENKYSYSGDEATLDFYIKKNWIFTVMKIDTAQMKKNPDGSFAGEVTPTRFQFKTEQFVYPLKITQISVKDKTEALFYVQAPYKTDLAGDMTYQYQWIPMLLNARGWYSKGIFGNYELPGRADDWLKALGPDANTLVQKGQQLGYGFNSGRRPAPNQQGKTATTLEWARQLSLDDIKLCKGEVAFSESVPDPDEGFTRDDLKDANRRDEIYKTIRARVAKYRQERPGGWLVREAPEDEVKKLKELLGHLQEGQFVTKFRRTFIKGEMNDDLKVVAAKWGDAADTSEYTESLPTSPP